MIYGLLTSQEPIVHGEIPEYGTKRKSGAPLMFNKRNIAYLDTADTIQIYKTCQIPAITGNSTRGQTRRPFILKTLQTLETPEKSIHPEILHLLAAGGGTGKGDTAGADQFKFKQEIRKLLPFVNLLGGSLRGMFLKGMLRVGFAYPIVEETRWMIADTPFSNRFKDITLLTAADLNEKLDMVRLTRRKIDDDFLVYSESLETLPVDEETTETDETDDNDEVNRDKGAVYSAETLPAGIHFFTYFELRRKGDELLDAALHAFVQSFIEMGTLGGYVAKGCGRVKSEFKYQDGTPFDAGKAEKYWQYLRDNKDKINQYLSKKLVEYLQSSDKAREEKKKKAAKSKS
jgi:CRISPR type IV-associated protein Csf2